MSSALVPLLRAQDESGLAGLLADDVRFHSPVADYSGRADVAHLFGLIAGVLKDISPVREVTDGSHVTTFIEAMFGDGNLQGVLDQRYDNENRLTEATLLLRPLGVLHRAIAEMGDALQAAPLPSTR
ncbi:nuclear transport factor 2 family protein [Amycolatopsis magusensis]|uniref:nuclear transport factor 2 family protein n=1 Tax=Amycolatopsis magusensis TaxID=882444 RepID=UPI003798AD16